MHKTAHVAFFTLKMFSTKRTKYWYFNNITSVVLIISNNFHFSVSSGTFLTASWLAIFVSAESSRTIISIDRSKPRFESHTGVKKNNFQK